MRFSVTKATWSPSPMSIHLSMMFDVPWWCLMMRRLAYSGTKCILFMDFPSESFSNLFLHLLHIALSSRLFTQKSILLHFPHLEPHPPFILWQLPSIFFPNLHLLQSRKRLSIIHRYVDRELSFFTKMFKLSFFE